MSATPTGSKLSADLLDAAVELMGESGRGGTVRVQGLSMVPTLRPGQRLAVEFSPEAPTPGDMLVFRRDDFLVVHRLLGPARSRSNGKPMLRTRGDGLPHLDPPLDEARIVGRVVAVEDDTGWRTVRTPGAVRYGRWVARHDLFWSVVGLPARLADRVLAKAGISPKFRPIVTAVDRWTLARAHGLFFRRLHPSIPTPPEAGGDR